ncbi:MAG: response regulator transcription factor [Phycisphaerae bacterium]
MAKKRIIIIEDERDMADLVAMQLRREHYEVDLAYDGAAGLEKIQSNPPDLALVDIMLPGLPGTEVLKEIRNDPHTAHVPVVFMTARSEESDIVVGLHLGADDYVTKPFSMSVLSARVAAVLRRSENSPAEKDMLSAGPIHINRTTHQVDVDGEPVSLTLTEFRLLVAIVAAKGRVLTRDQLITKAMGVDAVVTDRTIDVHLTALRRKLGGARKYIRTVRGVGYQLAVDGYETT